MSAQETFTNIDDNALIERLSRATQRVVFIAPGLRDTVARILEAAFARLPGNVTVILDVAAEVCRLGQETEKKWGRFVPDQPVRSTSTVGVQHRR
jgi:hypothetical protein